MSEKNTGHDDQRISTAHRILAAIEPLIYAKRKLTMAILLVITAVLLVAMVQIKPDAGFDKSVPLEHPYMKVLKQYMADFGGANTVLVGLLKKPGKGDIYEEKFLTDLKQATDEVFYIKGVDRSRVSSLFTPDVTFVEVVEGGFKGGNVIPADYAPTEEMFQRVKGNVNKGGHVGRFTTKDQTGALIFAELLEIDPVTGEKLDYGRVADDLEDRLRGRFTNPKMLEYKLKADKEVELSSGKKETIKAGTKVATGYTDLGIKKYIKTFDYAFPLEEGKTENVEVRALDTVVEQVDNPQYNPDVDIRIIGFAKVVGDIIEEIFAVVGFFGLTLIMTGILLWLYVGDFKLGMLPLICSITAVIWEFGLLKLFGKGLDPFAILVPFLILAVSVSHGVQYVNAWVGEIADNKRNSFDASLFTWRRLAIYGTMAIMTDVAGFAMIGLIPIAIVREMALNACLGMAAIIVTNKVMMPIWLTWIDIKDIDAFVAKQEKRDGIFDPLWRLLSNMVRPVPAITAIMIAAVLLGWSLWQGKTLQVGDSQAGVPELLPESRYNQDTAAVVANFAIGLDILKTVAETDADGCIKYDVMEQVDRYAWHMDNTPGVQSTLSLPQIAKTVNSAFSEANPRFKVLPRNHYSMSQSTSQVPSSSGLLNSNCSAMAIFIFMKDHKAETLEQAVDTTKMFNQANAAAFYDTHKDVSGKYCSDKGEARRNVGNTRTALQKAFEQARKDGRGSTDAELSQLPDIKPLVTKVTEAEGKLASFDKECPVNFALATGNVGVMAATNEEVHRLEKQILLYVYIAIVICVYLSFFEWQSIVAIMLPLGLISWMAYAVMAILGIGMKVATLPVVALAVGIGVDYGIYIYATFADALAGGFKPKDAYYKTLKMTGKAVVFTGITLGFGVATWLWSGLQFQRDMGALLVFMFTGNMFGAILILPAIASFILEPRELAPGESPVFKPRH